MGRHQGTTTPLAPAKPVGVVRKGPHSHLASTPAADARKGPPTQPNSDGTKRSGRRNKSRPFFVSLAFLAAVGFLLVNIVDPYSGATASPDFALGHSDRFEGQPIQDLAVAAGYENTVTREAYTVKEKPKPPPPPPVVVVPSSSSGSGGAPAVGTPDPGSAQAYALTALQARGMGNDQFNCLVALWNRESHWNVYAYNAGSGAYGIPQALPGSKMASAGADWQTSAATQINWGLGYVIGRYGTPCGAWNHSESTGWY
ncbi:aggregation-promoting factor C-terminal-like domain-containing protein [Rathayibacter soli]|uniref:aggregation-promoting factor C-terminal-like domain-containing protein n=1 Tax=Rathayibacter soli TaxID=3144168 RepID=UPI0027E4F252|nr:lytic transglycosylase domain-containing protein [Glaciibacter superstes]